MQIVGLIPARSGSKRVPGKNIIALAGQPLLAYTCEAALSSKRIDRVLLSTDDEAIAEVGRACGVEVPFLRPPELARDDTPSIAVAQHAVRWLREQAEPVDILILLQPTSPLRRAQHIDEALDRLLETNADTVVSVVEVPHQFSPYKVMRLQGDRLEDFWQEPVPFDRYRHQDVPKLYARNGPAVLATRKHVIMEQGTFYGEKTVPYLMNMIESMDVDSPDDLMLVEAVLAQRKTAL